MSKSVIYFYQVVEYFFDNERNTEMRSNLIHKTYKKAIDELFDKDYNYKKINRTDEIEYFYRKRESKRSQYDDFAYIERLELPKNEIKEF